MAAAIVSGERDVRSSVVHAQIEVHRPYGGVVPELASRDHVRAVYEVVEAALEQAGLRADELDGIAVTAGPGLMGSLLVGLSFAQALAYRLRVPVVGVHHLQGHLVSAELSAPELSPPYLGLVVSGGHTALYRVEESATTTLGETRDDAVGEAFDKVARLLGLPYPGGPSIAAAAQEGDEAAVTFPRPMEKSPGLDFSYSGLKTAVALEVERRGRLTKKDVSDLAASFQAAATDTLVQRARRALRGERLDRIVVVGGVAANARLRERMAQMVKREGAAAVFPPLSLCTDNAAMIAAAGARRLAGGANDIATLSAFSRVVLGSHPWGASGSA